MTLGELRCSFCSKQQTEVKVLVEHQSTYVCNECVELCRSIVWGSGAQPSGRVMFQVEGDNLIIIDEQHDVRFSFSMDSVSEEIWRRFCERVKQVARFDFSEEVGLAQKTLAEASAQERDWETMLAEVRRTKGEEEILRASLTTEIDWTSREKRTSDFVRECEAELAKVRKRITEAQNRLNALREQMKQREVDG